MSEVNIVGILITAFPEKLAAVLPQIESMGGEVHLHDRQGRIIVTLEAENDQFIGDCLLQLQNIEGVLTAHMVYHEIDDI